MDKKILLIIVASLCLGCANRLPVDNLYGLGKQQPAPSTQGPEIFDPTGGDLNALPTLSELPVPPQIKGKKEVATFTGVIKNTTKYEVYVPSLNSGATLTIPPHSWIEYVAYTRTFDLTVFSNGKPFYCIKVFADPKSYQYGCKNYDFIAEIVKPEPVKRAPKGKMKRFKRKPKTDQATEGVG